jgi:hypothetical protein
VAAAVAGAAVRLWSGLLFHHLGDFLQRALAAVELLNDRVELGLDLAVRPGRSTVRARARQASKQGAEVFHG